MPLNNSVAILAYLLLDLDYFLMGVFYFIIFLKLLNAILSIGLF